MLDRHTPASAAATDIGLPSTQRLRTGLALLLWLWFGCVVAINVPGHLTTDSLIQIAEGRTGYIDSWNPLFSSWVFGNLVDATGGTEVIVLLSALMLTAAIWMLVSAGGGSGLWRLIPVAALLFSPILLTYPGIVWKDVWFAHSAALAFGMIMWRARGGGWWWEVPTLVLLATAMLSRQTGIIVCVVAVAGMSISAPTPLWRFKGRRVGRWAGFVLRLVVMLMAAQGLNLVAKEGFKQIRGDAVGTGFQLVATYDVAGMLQREPDAQLTLMRGLGFNTQAWETAARQTFSSERIDTLVQPPITGPQALTASIIVRQWWDLVMQYPGAYAAHRLSTFAWFNGLQDQARCLPVHVGIDPPELAGRAGIRSVPSRWSAQLYTYSRAFLATPYFAPLAWSALSILVLAVYAWRRAWSEPVAWMQMAGLAYSLSYLAAGISCDVRYSYFSILAASIGLMRLLTNGLPLPRTQHT